MGKNPNYQFQLLLPAFQFPLESDNTKLKMIKMFKELFIAFNQRYDERFNNILNDIDAKTQLQEAYILTESEKNLVVDYLNLCAEEYLWYKKQRIDKSAWLSWENGMIYYLKIRPIKEIVEREKKQKDSYYGLFDKLKI
ncbi:MAG: hypothetical protein BGP13_08085 [Sphingobacteriales bacterium 40-81]|nr:MAG: hypothetical protein BGP13_08085 [Sphingobacteriales bacterium 40-81]